MRAIELPEFGGPEVLRAVERPIPEPGPNDVQIAVAFCGVCRHDLLTRAGAFPNVLLPVILGHQVSGVISAAGTAVAEPAIGDRVMTMIYTGCGRCTTCVSGDQGGCLNMRPRFLGEDFDGGYADFVTVRADTVVPIPDQLPLASAAAVICTLGTAYHAIVTRARVKPEETVVITGASGGVGIHAVQVARRAGAQVIAVTSRAEAAKDLRSLGASHVVVAPDRRFAAQVKELTQGRGADSVIDVTGADTLNASIHAVRPGGVVVVLGNVAGQPATIWPAHLILKEISLMGTKSCTLPEVREVTAAIVAGELSVEISDRVPLEDAPTLHRAMESGAGQSGRVVLEVGGDRL